MTRKITKTLQKMQQNFIILFILSSLINNCESSRRHSDKKSSIYLNEFAVEVQKESSKSLDETANEIAAQYGYINLGQVGNLEGFYMFKHRRIQKRSLRMYEHDDISTSRLRRNRHILMVEQQRVLNRVKRSPVSVVRPIEDPNDPAWQKMWYMHCGGPNKTDCPSSMRISDAWRAGYNGEGVVATILDDGIELDHPDLQKNYDAQASKDINGRDRNPAPRYDPLNENKHGTRCAGVVAAVSDNGICGVGVAYKAKIGGVRMLDGEVTDQVESLALGHMPNYVDIYSASWGPDDDGQTVEGPGPLAKAAFRTGVKMGRNGKGSIFVWASGNGGVPGDACSCDGYINSIYTIGISSASQTGERPWYLEACASTLATTYSSGNITEGKVITTDLHHECTYFHTGTSASAPMAAGVIALMLQANYNLTWRDVQHIIVRTSNPKGLQANDWVVNGAGYNVSHVFGFGLMDAARLTHVAKTWTTVPRQQECSTIAYRAAKKIPLNRRLQIPIDTNACSHMGNEILYLEHVILHITLSHPFRGALQIFLTSPSGTRSTILERRERDDSSKGFLAWDFMTTHHWGENPQGLWTLEILDNPPGRRRRGRRNLDIQGELRKWQLIFYGTRENPQPNFHFNKCDAFPQDQCHPECIGCCGATDNECKVCQNVATMEGRCVPSCEAGSFTDIKTSVCRTCWSTCKTCNDSGPYNCTSCQHGYEGLHGKCVKMCKEGQFRDRETELCRDCDPSCKSCAYHPLRCQSCRVGYKFESHSCTPSCAPGTYLYGRLGCRPCHSTCKECNRASATQCRACYKGFFLHKRTCMKHCPRKYYGDEDTRTCKLCAETCKSCNGPNEGNCTSCSSELTLSLGHCKKICRDVPAYRRYCHLISREGRCENKMWKFTCCESCDTLQ